MKSSKLSSSRVTLRDIAESLGVSLMTVSMALRNHPKISMVRQRQVQEAARRMGYRPDAMAVALAHRRYDSMAHSIGSEIAWINCWKNSKQLRSFKEFDLYWHGAEQAAESHGFRLVEFIVDARLPFSRLDKILQSRNIQCLLIPPHGGNLEMLLAPPYLDWSKYSIVRLGYSIPHLPAQVVAGNHVQASMLAFANILKKGYRRIGYIHNTYLHTRSKAGFLMPQSDLPLQQRLPILVLVADQSMDSRLQQLHSWIKKNKPDAILAELAEIPWMLQQLGYRIPKDIGLAAISVLDGKVNAGLYQNSEEIGKAAIVTLISLMHHNQTGFPKLGREVLVDASWQDGSMLPRRRVSMAKKLAIPDMA